MNGNPLSPKSFSDLLPSLRRVASDAECRAKELRDFVNLLEQANPDELDAQVADQHVGPGWCRELLARVDAASHIHSGSSEASNVRTLTSGVFTLLGTLQREES